MCGRYVSPSVAEAERNLTVDLLHWSEYKRSYNVAPTQQVPVVRMFDAQREGLTMRWGLIPYFARGIPTKYSTINAALEKIQDGPTWRGPWKRAQRCLLPASGFYEWHVNADATKTPFYITLADQPVFGLAGLWESSVTEEGAAILSCTIITMAPNHLMAQIHNAKQRMPAILSREDIAVWLTGSNADAFAVLKAYPDDLMSAHPVSTKVNSPKNDDPSLIESIPDSGGGKSAVPTEWT